MIEQSAQSDDVGAVTRAFERTAEDVRRIVDDLNLDSIQRGRASPPEIVGRWLGAGAKVDEDAIGLEHGRRGGEGQLSIVSAVPVGVATDVLDEPEFATARRHEVDDARDRCCRCSRDLTAPEEQESQRRLRHVAEVLFVLVSTRYRRGRQPSKSSDHSDEQHWIFRPMRRSSLTHGRQAAARAMGRDACAGGPAVFAREVQMKPGRAQRGDAAWTHGVTSRRLEVDAAQTTAGHARRADRAELGRRESVGTLRRCAAGRHERADEVQYASATDREEIESTPSPLRPVQ